jgi:hypothetical protein
MADGGLIDWKSSGAVVASIGALGFAAFGVTESLGKAFAYCHRSRDGHIHYFGLPFVGLNDVEKMIRPLKPALEVAYGVGFMDMIAKQYRNGAARGSAPDLIRNGVRLGIPFLTVEQATHLIASVWHMDHQHSEALARALQAEGATPPPPPGPFTLPQPIDPAQALAGRFATALDARVAAAFAPAADRYENTVKTISGLVALLLVIGFNWTPHETGLFDSRFPWSYAFLVGVLAVPLAPIAKDLATSLQNAAAALKSLGGKS